MSKRRPAPVQIFQASTSYRHALRFSTKEEHEKLKGRAMKQVNLRGFGLDVVRGDFDES